MRIPGAATLAATLFTLFLTGCGGSSGSTPTAATLSTPAAPQTSPAASTPPSSATPTPTPSGPSVADLTQQVSHAKTPVTGAQFNAQDRSGVPPLDVCGGNIAAYALVKAVTVWQWLGVGGVPIFKEGIFGFQTITSADVVAQSRALATSCASHDNKIGGEVIKVTGNGQLRVTTPAGVDGFYAFCETQTILKPAIGAGVPIGYCTAVLSRGHLAVFLNAGGSTLAAARAAISKYVAPTAKALRAAVP
jgi:hypothetical protein